MTNETERKVANRAARGMRAAALRLALERTGQESDPTLAYSCVDWFRYDAPAQSQEPDTPAPPMAARRDARHDDASLHH